MTSEPVGTPTRQERIDASALYGLNFALEREGCDLLHTYDRARIAAVVARNAIKAGQFVTYEDHAAALMAEREKTDRWKQNWAHVGVERDRVLTRAQAALSALEDRDLATPLAEAIGVLLLPAEERAS